MGLFDRFFGKGQKGQPIPERVLPASETDSSAFPVIECSGKDAVERCLQLREERQSAGFYPLIIGDAEEMNRVVGSDIESEGPEAVAQILASAAKIEPVKFFENRKAGDPDHYDHVELGEWPSRLPRQLPITVVTSIRTGAIKPKVFIAKIPTTKGYEIPAYLSWGGWNECPMPEEHVVVLRHWNEVYGAEIISLTSDVLECTVSRPPTDKEAAFRLAHEQFIYCSDIIYQGVESLYALAAQLINSRTWYFWWD